MIRTFGDDGNTRVQFGLSGLKARRVDRNRGLDEVVKRSVEEGRDPIRVVLGPRSERLVVVGRYGINPDMESQTQIEQLQRLVALEGQTHGMTFERGALYGNIPRRTYTLQEVVIEELDIVDTRGLTMRWRATFVFAGLAEQRPRGSRGEGDGT